MDKFRTRIEQDQSDGYDVFGDLIGQFYTGEKAANYGFPCDVKLVVDDENTATFTPPTEAVYVHKVYGYSHSGMSISLEPFADKWDSAQIGFYVVEGSQAKFWLGDRYSEADLEKAVESSISTVDSVLRGEVYCVILEKSVDCGTAGHENTWEVVESLGGIIGYDQAEAEADAMIRYKKGIVDYQGEPV
jgi:hypothetical protein